MRIDTLFFVFNRPSHTFEVVKSLIEQTKYPEAVFVYFDKPSTKKDIEQQDIIKEHFRIIQLKDAYYIEQKENKGIKRSITETIAAHFEDGADAVIVLEDDIVMHQSFIQYMYDALNQYKDNDRINTVCGYRYPVLNFIKNRDENLYGMMIKRFNPWGWATWKDKWEFVDFNVLRTAIIPTVLEGQANILGIPDHLKEYLYMEEFINGTVDIWSINVVLRQYLTNTYSIYPSKQLVDNIGFDSSGVHSSTTTAFKEEVDWDVKYNVKLNMLSMSNIYEINLNEFLALHLKEVMFKNKKESPK
jgi:hypothetical protein